MFETLEVQFYLAAAVLGTVCVLLIFFMAGVCGALSKLKRLERQRQAEFEKHVALCCPSIQPGEQLGRRGFSMYSGYAGNELPLRVPLDRNSSNMNGFQNRVTGYNHLPDAHRGNGDGTKDAASDFSAIINSETVYVSSADKEMKILQTSSEYHAVPPPPSTLQRQARTPEQTVTTANNSNSQMVA